MPKRITIQTPYNFHVHLREGPMLAKVAPITANIFGRAVVMGNLVKGNLSTPIVTAADVERYRKEIMRAVGDAPSFEPLMTVMLVNRSTSELLQGAYEAGVRFLKLIPGGTSTGSGAGEDPDAGVALANLEKYYPVLEMAEQLGMAFLGHWELIATETGEPIREVDREVRAIPFLQEVIKRFPGLRIVVEHVTTRVMVQLVQDAPANVAATVTPHHLILTNKDVMDKDGIVIAPHNYCKPVAKSSEDRRAIVEAITSPDNTKFMAGTDSAPHPPESKQGDKPAAGIFNELVAPSVYTEIFEAWGALDRLDAFCSVIGANFHGLLPNEGTTTLVQDPWTVPGEISGIVPFLATRQVRWQVAS